MFVLIISFLRTHWQTTLIASVFVSILATFSFQRLEIHHLSRRLAECHDENLTLETSNKALYASIEDQNTAIASLQALARQKKNIYSNALAAAQAHASADALVAGKIKAEKLSKDECSDIKRIVDEYVKIP